MFCSVFNKAIAIPMFCGDPNLALMLLPCDDIVKLWSLQDNFFINSI